MHSNDKRGRRRHTAAFKAEAVAACRVPGASAAGVALERQLNANLLRRWVKEAARSNAVTRFTGAVSAVNLPAFVPVMTAAAKSRTAVERLIRVQVRKRGLRLTIEWPATAAESCAGWLRELLG